MQLDSDDPLRLSVLFIFNFSFWKLESGGFWPSSLCFLLPLPPKFLSVSVCHICFMSSFFTFLVSSSNFCFPSCQKLLLRALCHTTSEAPQPQWGIRISNIRANVRVSLGLSLINKRHTCRWIKKMHAHEHKTERHTPPGKHIHMTSLGWINVSLVLEVLCCL